MKEQITSMKNKKIIFFLALLLFGSIVINSCKKDDKSSINALFTDGSWQLASVQVFHYLGGSQVGLTDTLNATCDTTQIFTFNTNNTCTYTNFHCVSQPTATGTWNLSGDKLFLQCVIACKDTLPGGTDTTTTHPFVYAKIISVGQYSMLLQTGDIGTYFTATTKRTIYQYGFVHLRAPTK